ncbi:MAG: nuclear transport factor 2 family protein [Chloroflexota bacterium]
MSSEQIVRETLAAIEAHDLNKAAGYAADNLIVRDRTLPNTLDKNTFFTQMGAILQAFPDWKYEIGELVSQNNQVTVTVRALATHSNPLQLPGLPPIAATGNHVNVPDKFIFTVTDDKISALVIDSPPHGGAAEMLRQLGITLPSRL